MRRGGPLSADLLFGSRGIGAGEYQSCQRNTRFALGGVSKYAHRSCSHRGRLGEGQCLGGDDVGSELERHSDPQFSRSEAIPRDVSPGYFRDEPLQRRSHCHCRCRRSPRSCPGDGRCSDSFPAKARPRICWDASQRLSLCCRPAESRMVPRSDQSGSSPLLDWDRMGTRRAGRSGGVIYPPRLEVPAPARCRVRGRYPP
jgi:hypothetical protein